MLLSETLPLLAKQGLAHFSSRHCVLFLARPRTLRQRSAPRSISNQSVTFVFGATLAHPDPSWGELFGEPGELIPSYPRYSTVSFKEGTKGLRRGTPVF